MCCKKFRVALVTASALLWISPATNFAGPGPTPAALVPVAPPAPAPLAPPPPPPPEPQGGIYPTPPPLPSPIPTAPPTAGSLLEFGPSATVILPSSAASVVSHSINGIFQLVNLPQDQLVQVVVQYPTTKAAEVVKVEALDGGLLAASVAATVPKTDAVKPDVIAIPTSRVDSGTISAKGTFTFVFQPGHPPGLYQIRITQGTQVSGLQFWISDPQHSANNPPGLSPRTPDVPSPNPF